LIGEVVRFSARAGPPLGYCQGNYVSFGIYVDGLGDQRVAMLGGAPQAWQREPT
jgi:hypothetical protein